MQIRYLCSLCLIAVAASASAQEFVAEVTPFVGYRFGGELDSAESSQSIELDSAPSYGMLIDVFAGAGSVQFIYSQQRTDARIQDVEQGEAVSRVDTVIHAIQIGGTYRSVREGIQPYLAANVGALHVRTSAGASQSDTFLSGSLGVGVNARPTSNFDVRLEGRVYGAITDADTDLFCQTGADENVCAVRIEGEALAQFEVFAGFTFRF